MDDQGKNENERKQNTEEHKGRKKVEAGCPDLGAKAFTVFLSL
jgi:hypothetical protein